jgi:hypothetical protein
MRRALFISGAIVGGIFLVSFSVFFAANFGKGFKKGFDQAVAARSPEKLLERTSSNLNTTLPKQLDAVTRLDSTTAGPGRRFNYFYTLVNLTNNNKIDPVKFETKMRPKLIDKYKNLPELDGFRKLKVDLSFNYRDMNGNSVTQIVVSPNDF